MRPTRLPRRLSRIVVVSSDVDDRRLHWGGQGGLQWEDPEEEGQVLPFAFCLF